MIAKKVFFSSLVLFVALAFPLASFAQANSNPTGRFDLTVSPPVLELTAKPGEKVQEKFRVRNNLGDRMVLQVQARRLISDPASGSPTPESDVKGEELAWVTIDKPTFTALPNEWEDITFTIDIPENAAYGYYYVFRITPKEDPESTVTGSKIKGELLVVTLLTVKKDGANSKTELVDFKAKNGISEYLPTDFVVKLANKGNVHVKPRGNIFISRGSGKEISILDVNAANGSILPGGTREFEAAWSDGFIVSEPVMEGDKVKLDANGRPSTKLAFNWNKLTDFRIGPYTARLLMVYDDGTKDITIEGATTFWVIPYVAIGVFIVVLIVAIVILRFILKMYISRAIKNSRSR